MLELETPQDIDALRSSVGKVAVVVYGANCGPCNMLKQYISMELEPTVEAVTFAAISGTDNRDWAVDLGIRTVPTTLMFDGENRKVITGFVPSSKEQYLKAIEEFFAG